MNPIEIYRRTPERDQILRPRRSHVPPEQIRQQEEIGRKTKKENGESNTVICRIGTRVDGVAPKYNCVYYENGESLDGMGTPAILYALEIAGDVVLEGMYCIAHIMAVQRTGENQ